MIREIYGIIPEFVEIESISTAHVIEVPDSRWNTNALPCPYAIQAISCGSTTASSANSG